MVTSDRDAFALIDASTSVLRVRNGGLDEAVLVTPAALPEVCGVQPWQYRDFAALRGDPSDNLPGVRGFGSATAARLLAAFGTRGRGVGRAGRRRRAARSGTRWASTPPSSLGTAEMRAVVERNRRLMRDARRPAACPTSTRPACRWTWPSCAGPCSPAASTSGPSLWALTGGTPPRDRGGAGPGAPALGVDNAVAHPRQPAPGQLALF